MNAMMKYLLQLVVWLFAVGGGSVLAGIINLVPGYSVQIWIVLIGAILELLLMAFKAL